ncbi:MULTISPECIES: lytic transglycosylase domain-containing protein [unclassified Xanthobacter]|uniref:lytic transglycosylase domain-containing protein n=1 Tax=unclassified Xanthobacter TaxID=2623496 RepID=UPI002105DF37|nr:MULTISPECIES: lytic transglycosylase domain-containing protein [unclassified Xanthobacter]
MLRTRLTLPAIRRPVRLRARYRAAAILLLSGVSWGGPTAALPAEVQAVQKAPSPVDRYADFIAEAAERFDIPAAWIRAVLRAERDGDPRSVSPTGAMGPMQIMPATWAELRIHYGLGDDPYDPHDNIMAGAAHLRELFDRNGNPGFLAAYNAGPTRDEASPKGHPLPLETRAYVDKLAPDIAHGETEHDARKLSAPPAIEMPSWSRSPIFALPPIRVPAADPVSPDHAQPVSDVRDVSAIVPQSDGLFVARGGTGGAP